MVNISKPTLIAILWTLLISTSCLIPASTFKPFSFDSFLQIDKVLHIIMFFGFIFLWLLSISAYRELTFSVKSLLFVIGVLFGILIEFLQSHMHLGRSFELDDMIADGIGALLGVLFINIIIKYISFFKKYVPFVKTIYAHL